MSFFTEWDFYYIPKTDFSKWINYKYKTTKLYNNECISPKAQTADKQWCNAKKIIAGIYNCSNCDGSGWSLWGNKCWRSKMGCYSSGTYSYNGLCYNENSACKPEMVGHQDEFHCKSDWNVRDLNYYELSDSTSNCSCTGACYYGAKNVGTYDKTLFDVFGGIGSTKIIKSVTLVCQDKDKIFCDEMKKVFRIRVQLTKITSWDFLDKLKTFFNTNMNTSYDHINYLNFIGQQIVEFYLMMNVATGNDLSTSFKSYVPLFLVLNTSSSPALLDVNVNPKSTRDYSLQFYGSNTRSTSCSTTSPCVIPQKTINKTYVSLSGGAIPQSNLTFKTIGTQGMFLVQPIQFCVANQTTDSSKYDKIPKYTETTPIVYLVYYDMANISDQNRNVIKELKEKFIDNVNITSSPCRAWNTYVYYNHILPNICYQVEMDSTYCNPIMNYDASPPIPVSQKCSLVTSNRFPDCKTFLMTSIEREQPKQNQTRTYDKLDTAQKTFCTQYDTLECQCFNRALKSKSSYKLFETSGLAVNSVGNAGCWYKPCMDDPSTNIFVEKEMRSDRRNCAPTVCENVISVMNRPANSVNISNMNLRTSCSILATATPKPKVIPTTSLPEIEPVETEIPTEETIEPEPNSEEETTIIALQPEEEISYKTLYIYLFLYILAFIIFVSIFILLLIRPTQLGLAFKSVIIIFVSICIFIIVFKITSYVRFIFNMSSTE